MYARTSYSADDLPSFMISGDEREDQSQDFYAGDPVCPQTPRRSETVSYTSLLLLLALTVGCAFATDADTRRDWTSKIERVASSLSAADPSAPPPSKEAASIPAPASAPMPPPSASVVEATAQPLPEVRVTNAPGESDGSDSEKTSGKSSVSDAYAPPPPSSDPYVRKAEAVGLHPDLSRAVLARLTPIDYRNAAYAIEKAVKTVPDDKELTWPRAHKPGLAIFNVHFVQGAAHDCRRYIVTITKDRWTSTALPMQKCGVKVAYRGEGKEKSLE